MNFYKKISWFNEKSLVTIVACAGGALMVSAIFRYGTMAREKQRRQNLNLEHDKKQELENMANKLKQLKNEDNKDRQLQNDAQLEEIKEYKKKKNHSIIPALSVLLGVSISSYIIFKLYKSIKLKDPLDIFVVVFNAQIATMISCVISLKEPIAQLDPMEQEQQKELKRIFEEGKQWRIKEEKNNKITQEAFNQRILKLENQYKAKAQEVNPLKPNNL